MGLPGESRRIAAHSTSAGTSPIAHTAAENPMSKTRLIARYPAPPRRGAATVGSGAGGTNTPSIAWCPPLTLLSTPPDSASWSSDANSSASTMTAVSDPKIACDLDSSTAPSLANGVSSTSILNTPPPLRQRRRYLCRLSASGRSPAQSGRSWFSQTCAYPGRPAVCAGRSW